MPESLSSPVPVALLHEAGGRGGVLKNALNQLGAAIVYESLAAEFDSDALAGSGARIVVFNLDPDSDAQIDDVYDALDEGGYEVLFNDADASDQLSGSDQARWTRHLAAKILHNPDIAEPPRPPWAESVPTPEQRAAAVPSAAPAPAAAEPLQEAEATHAAPDVPAPPMMPASIEPAQPEPFVPDLPDVEMAEMELPEEPPAMPEPVQADTATQEVVVPAEFNLAETAFDLDESEQIELTGDFADALDDFAAQVPAHKHGAGSADELASQLDTLFSGAPVDHDSGAGSPDIEQAEFPAVFDELDEAAAAIPEATDSTFKPAPLQLGGPAPAETDDTTDSPFQMEAADDGTAAPEPVAAADASAVSPLLPPEWSLEPLDENTEITPPAGKASAFGIESVTTTEADEASAFGIETMTTTDFMGSDDDRIVAPEQISDGLSLELVPMEDAVAPEEFAEAVPASVAAPSQQAGPAGTPLKVGRTAPLSRVIVLGASIGGPEAIREFLGAVPRDFPALFVLAQHMGDEFLELMCIQLAKAVDLTVRTPTHGERVGHGEIVIVPTQQRMQIDNEGVITLSPLIERTAYSPSIDQVMRDIADEFGARASAIVFSGMAQDAIEGSKYLKSLGGTVWAQDPASCTISTMVDSVRQTGTVEFVGSPQELAARIVAEYSPDR